LTTFVDTSALYALLDGDDANHAPAAAWFAGPARASDERLLTHNYVLVEAAALVHRRLGPTATRDLLEDLLPLLSMWFVDEDLHRTAAAAFLAAVRRRPSLVDWVSFELMRRRGIRQAFAFDRDFVTEGFRTVP
jgi:predicted nucleic acid-binding protein